MEATSLDQLTESEADLLLGIEPSSVVMRIVSEEVIPARSSWPMASPRS